MAIRKLCRCQCNWTSECPSLHGSHLQRLQRQKSLCMRRGDDMERLTPGSANPNAFSDIVTRLCKEYNDAHPTWQAFFGGDVRSARFEYLPVKVAPCALTARRNMVRRQVRNMVQIFPLHKVVGLSRAEAYALPPVSLSSGRPMGTCMGSSSLNCRSFVTSTKQPQPTPPPPSPAAASAARAPSRPPPRKLRRSSAMDDDDHTPN